LLKNVLNHLCRRAASLSPVQWVRLVLGVLAAVLTVVLLVARKPWTVIVPPDRVPKVGDLVAIYVWIALLLDLVLLAFLAATASFWVGEPVAADLSAVRPAAPRWFWPLVILAMLVNAALCWPRLNQSFWHDEDLPLGNAILGKYKTREDGSLVLREVSWLHTFFFYRKPNHMLYSALARTGNDIWRAAARPVGLPFHEGVIRFPAFLAGIGSVATLALLLRHFGMFSAGVFAAFLTALHPWHIRYGSEARAYAFVLLLVPVVIWTLVRALGDGRWRWWLAFAAAEFFLLYFYPLCLHFLIVLNLCALAALALGRGTAGRFFGQAARLVVGNLFAAMVFLPLILPCVPQFLEYVKGTPGQGRMTAEWAQNFLAHALAGITWVNHGFTEPNVLELSRIFAAQPVQTIAVMVVAVLLFAAGVRVFLARGLPAAVVPVIVVLPPILCFWETAARGGYIYVWYLLFVLPGAIAMVAVGMEQLIGLFRSRTLRTLATAGCVLLLGGYTAWTAPQRDFLLRHSLQPNRESVLATRPTLDPLDPRQKGILTATFYGPPDPYDPNIIKFRSARELGDLVRRADAEGKPLFINLGYLTTVEGEHAIKYHLLKTSGMFEDVGIFSGFEPTMLSRHVFRYIPGSAKDFDFNSLPPDRGRPGTAYSY
jgi:hypothetical protein